MPGQLPGYLYPQGGGSPSTTLLSGTVSSGELASGLVVPYARALFDQFTTTEIISGGRAVALNQSGLALIYMASVSGRRNYVGVAPDNWASGVVADIYRDGTLLSTALSVEAGMSGGISGYAGQLIFAGRSGNLTGSLSSGQPQAPILSGDVQQSVGFGVSWSGIYLGRF